MNTQDRINDLINKGVDLGFITLTGVAELEVITKWAEGRITLRESASFGGKPQIRVWKKLDNGDWILIHLLDDKDDPLKNIWDVQYRRKGLEVFLCKGKFISHQFETYDEIKQLSNGWVATRTYDEVVVVEGIEYLYSETQGMSHKHFTEEAAIERFNKMK